MARAKGNGEGSIYCRKDGRWVGSVFVDLTDGRRSRVSVYGKTRKEAHDLLADRISKSSRGVRTPTTQWLVGDYLDDWLTNVVAAKNRPRTAELYESTVRMYLRPALGRTRESKLTVTDVQRVLNAQQAKGLAFP